MKQHTETKHEDWNLYPGNEAGAFDHLDNAPKKETPSPPTHVEGKFTPGEWKIDEQKPTIIRINEFIRVEQVLELDNCDSAKAYDNFTKYGEAEANAALIAEAKNMFLALKDFCEAMGNGLETEMRAYNNAKAILNRINPK